MRRCFCWHQNFVPRGLSAPSPGLYTCIKSDFKEIFFKLVANDRSDKRLLLTSKFCSLGIVCPDLRLYTFIKSWKDVYSEYIVKSWRDFFKTCNKWPKWWGLPVDIKILVSCLCPRAMYTYKIWGQSYFLKHATSDQSDKTFLLSIYKTLMRGLRIDKHTSGWGSRYPGHGCLLQITWQAKQAVDWFSTKFAKLT